MTRALLVCPEPLGHKQPAGIGIRFLEIERALRADGHDVTLLAPDDGAITPERLEQLTAACDVAVVQGHIANDLFAHGRPIPTVVDLYDPYIIENLHYFAARGAEVFAHDHSTLVQSLLRGDFFLCASDAQRLFYLGAMLAVGRLNPIAFASDPHLNELIAVAPFGVPPLRAATPRDLEAPRVLFGGIYDWYDPILAIEAVALARERLPRLTLTFNAHPNPDLTPQGKAAEATEHVRRKSYDFVHFEPWVQYNKRADYYDRFSVALLTFPQSIETDLSMRTRVYDYLWGGLPVVTSSAPGTDEILARYGAGVIVRSSSARDFADAIVNVMRHEHARMSEGARLFAADHQWSRTLQPLVEFVRAPRAGEHRRAPRRPSILARLKRRMGGSL